jgi:hypothetical protein
LRPFGLPQVIPSRDPAPGKISGSHHYSKGQMCHHRQKSKAA